MPVSPACGSPSSAISLSSAAPRHFPFANESASVVGNTAIFCWRSTKRRKSQGKVYQGVQADGATTNCTCVHYGTTWDDTTLLEEVKQANLELERRDGIKRHFRFDWQDVAKYNPTTWLMWNQRRFALARTTAFPDPVPPPPIHGGAAF